ncbi:MAG: hypothetical protein WCH30_07965 [Chlorobiaceae bacterium]
MAQKVSEIIKDANHSTSPARTIHLGAVMAKIADLEARGLIKRQQYKAFTTADFERDLAKKMKRNF